MMTRVKYVIGPDGAPLMISSLPSPDTTRWTTRRKAEVVLAVQGGLLSMAEACDRYRLSVEEFLDWQRAIQRHGVKGLRSTWSQQYKAMDNGQPDRHRGLSRTASKGSQT